MITKTCNSCNRLFQVLESCYHAEGCNKNLTGVCFDCLEKKFQSWEIVIVKSNIPNQGYPFKPNEPVYFISEIPNMPDHCVVMTRENKIYAGYHTDNFRKAKETEL